MSERKTAYRYVNVKGVVYYLHQGTTKTGKPRYYFAQSIGADALEEMPAGYEVKESVNGVVSVARSSGRPAVPPSHLETVRQVLQKHQHLHRHRVGVVGDAIVVFEPRGFDLAGLEEHFPGAGARLADMRARHFDPVVKFVRVKDGAEDAYFVCRMTYRGNGGWSYPLGHGALAEWVDRILPHVGKETFFNQY